MVRPTTRSLTPSADAIPVAPSTSQREPRTSRPRPPRDEREVDREARPRARRRARDRRRIQRARLGGGPAPGPQQPPGVGHEPRREQRAVERSEAAVAREDDDQGAGADHHGHVEAHQLAGDHERRDQGRDAEDEQHVEDVAADDVAQRQAVESGATGADAHRELRRAGAERHDGQPDDERREPDRQGQARGAPHEQLRAADQDGEPHEQHEGVDDHGWRSPAGTGKGRRFSSGGNGHVAYGVCAHGGWWARWKSSQARSPTGGSTVRKRPAP